MLWMVAVLRCRVGRAISWGFPSSLFFSFLFFSLVFVWDELFIYLGEGMIELICERHGYLSLISLIQFDVEKHARTPQSKVNTLNQ